MSAPARVEPRAGRRLGLAMPVVLLVGVAMAAGYFGWVRHLAAFQIRSVAVEGLSAKDPPEVRRALEAQARSMTTLAVDEHRLELAVANYPAIRSLDTVADLPDRLTIRVHERRAVAMLAAPGAKPVAVAADGTLLRERRLDPRLGRIRVPGVPAGARVEDRRVRGLIRVAAAAPAALHPRIARIEHRGRLGAVVRLRGGPELRMGRSAGEPLAWAVVARVLAQRSARGAAYVDVRMPDRPVAGGFADVAPPASYGPEQPSPPG